MSASAFRFAPAHRAQRGIRFGAIAYQGIMASVIAEREAEQARLDSIEPPLIAHAATYDYQTKQYRKHYDADWQVRITRVSRGHLELKVKC